MKKSKVLLLVICIIFVSTNFIGCWNYIDVEQQFVVMGMAIDFDPATDEYIIYIEVSKAKGGSEAKLVTRVGSARGITLFDANRNLISKIGSKVYWGHTMVFIVSERVAERGLVNVLEILIRQTQVRSDIYIIVVDNKSIEKIFEFDDPIHDTVSQHLQDLLKFYEASGKYRKSPLFTVLKEIGSDEISLMLPYIKMQETKKSDDTSGSTEGEGEKDNTSKENPQEIIVTDGSIVFNGDKMVGKLDGMETQSALILKDEINNNYSLTISNDKGLPNCSVEVVDSTIKITPTIVDNNLNIEIKLEIEADIMELHTKVDFIQDEEKNALEIGFENMLIQQLHAVIKKTQEDFASDIFGFAGYTHRREHIFYKNNKDNWDKVYENANIDIKVDVIMQGSALTSQPIKVGQ